jgi:hypothetical protein
MLDKLTLDPERPGYFEGLDLGSVMLHHITYVNLVPVLVMLILIVWRIGFGVTGMECVGVMPTVQGLSGAMLEACG